MEAWRQILKSMWTGKSLFNPYIRSKQWKWGKSLQNSQISSNSKDKVNYSQCILMFDHTKHHAASEERYPVLIPPYLIIPNYVISSPFHEIQQPWSQRYINKGGKETKNTPQNPTNKRGKKPQITGSTSLCLSLLFYEWILQFVLQLFMT